MSQEWNDLSAVIRAIARDEVRGQRVTAWGYIAAFDPKTYTVKVEVPTFQSPTEYIGFTTDWIPLGTGYGGSHFGMYFFPKIGTPAFVCTVDPEGSGEHIVVCLHNNLKNPPPGLSTLQEGDAILINEHGSFLELTQGTIQLQRVPGTGVPVAVEGSVVTHDHGLTFFVNSLIAATNAYMISNPTAPIVTTGVGTDIVAILQTLTPAPAAGPPIVTTDTAGKPDGASIFTVSEVDTGTGAQSVIAPESGGS